MLARRRKIEFTLGVRKYRRDENNALKRDNPKFTDDQIYRAIEEDKKSEVFISINSWLNQQNDLSEVWNDMRAAIEAKFTITHFFSVRYLQSTLITSSSLFEYLCLIRLYPFKMWLRFSN